jgi:hypothetical protein
MISNMRRTGRLEKSLIKFGSFNSWDGIGDTFGRGGPSSDFAPSCEDGDTRTATVWFNRDYGGKSPTWAEPEFSKEPVVIVTPKVVKPDYVAAPVGVITSVTRSNFTVSFRNSGGAGQADFYWMAVNPGQEPGGWTLPLTMMISTLVPDLRRGIRLGMLHFPLSSFVPNYDHSNVVLPVPLYKSLDAILVTGNNQFVFGSGPSIGPYNVSSSVGIVEGQNTGAFKLNSINTDRAVVADRNFYWTTLGILEEDEVQPNLFIETADSLSAKEEINLGGDFARSRIGPFADMEQIDVAFKTQFPCQPVVFVTARITSDSMRTATDTSPVGIVINVSPFGFRLWMTNNACADGFVDFNWIAFSYPEPVGV